MFGRKFKAVRGIATLGVVAGVGLWAAVLPATAIVYSGPITITSGGVYTGNWASTDPAVPASLSRPLNRLPF